MPVDSAHCIIADSPYGKLLLRASADGKLLASVDLLTDAVAKEIRTSTPVGPAGGMLQEIAQLLRKPLDGRAHPDLLGRCDWQGQTSFRQAVLTTLFQHVGPGSTISYGQLATLIGSPNAARAVGSALRNNPFPALIPCHRVLARNGLGGFMGNIPGADTRKRAMLAAEGVRV